MDTIEETSSPCNIRSMLISNVAATMHNKRAEHVTTSVSISHIYIYIYIYIPQFLLVQLTAADDSLDL